MEIINLLTVGLSSLFMKDHIPSDILDLGQFIHSDNLKSQEYLHKINEKTQNNKMVISENKTKPMIFNFTENY